MHEGQPSGTPPDGPSYAVRCAWCGRILRRGRWTGLRIPSAHDVEAHVHRSRTHGICPDCFRDLAPGVPYPDEPRAAGGTAD